ncbi:uncharacterized protein MONOS_6895 [Monocercomonoides exilis]|uniref:uncharacterized protein n=1 Tax=Monocercomonoides exilis TaxID=2049356 RepID=UPI00355A7683|nr:hypothetical protein MONOS_6895 [Monocercomonoides exilis]|eukprot:MONOS_6895.1-p1 / transcript=MONOS_6895.1 / gene=MONOS_6895 / organism=Monocercomonoides_exilis_PA203 / gene_product=unspecified product / transcript_product=unspecified product / location=Mono_scaffold00226:21888-24554(+) / protein_length=889 / sequence_SO=supercontig / SO=protein_coding / is_pseudo=false
MSSSKRYDEEDSGKGASSFLPLHAQSYSSSLSSFPSPFSSPPSISPDSPFNIFHLSSFAPISSMNTSSSLARSSSSASLPLPSTSSLFHESSQTETKPTNLFNNLSTKNISSPSFSVPVSSAASPPGYPLIIPSTSSASSSSSLNPTTPKLKIKTDQSMMLKLTSIAKTNNSSASNHSQPLLSSSLHSSSFEICPLDISPTSPPPPPLSSSSFSSPNPFTNLTTSRMVSVSNVSSPTASSPTPASLQSPSSTSSPSFLGTTLIPSSSLSASAYHSFPPHNGSNINSKIDLSNESHFSPANTSPLKNETNSSSSISSSSPLASASSATTTSAQPFFLSPFSPPAAEAVSTSSSIQASSTSALPPLPLLSSSSYSSSSSSFSNSSASSASSFISSSSSSSSSFSTTTNSSCNSSEYTIQPPFQNEESTKTSQPAIQESLFEDSSSTTSASFSASSPLDSNSSSPSENLPLSSQMFLNEKNTISDTYHNLSLSSLQNYLSFATEQSSDSQPPSASNEKKTLSSSSIDRIVYYLNSYQFEAEENMDKRKKDSNELLKPFSNALKRDEEIEAKSRLCVLQQLESKRGLVNTGSVCSLSSICQCFAALDINRNQVAMMKDEQAEFIQLFEMLRKSKKNSKVWNGTVIWNFYELKIGPRNVAQKLTDVFDKMLDMLSDKKNKIYHMFSIYSKNVRKCTHCENFLVSNRETRYYFTINGSDIIRGLLKSLTNVNLITEQRNRMCNMCETDQPCIPFVRFVSFPEILTINHNVNETFRVLAPPKSIVFIEKGQGPNELDIKNPFELKEERDLILNGIERSVVYDFVGCIIHSTAIYEQGHFIAIVKKDVNRPSYSSIFLECNDNSVSEIIPDKWEDYWIFMSQENWKPSLSFYKKVM